jgi:hypothetical protein
MDIDPDKLNAAIEQLEAEKERRLNEKVAAGEIVHVELHVIGCRPEDTHAKVPAAKARKLAELRAAGEKREIIFDVIEVSTGVPRPWDFPNPDVNISISSAPGPENPAVSEAVQSSSTVVPSQPETYVRVETRHASDDGSDPGAIEEGYFSVDDGVLILRDRERNHIIARRVLRGGQDPARLARDLLRETAVGSDFNRRIQYPKMSLV